MALILVGVRKVFSLLFLLLEFGCAPEHDRMHDLIFIGRVQVLMLQQELQFILVQQAKVRIIKDFAEVARDVIQHLWVRVIQLYVDADIDFLWRRLIVNIKVGKFSQFGWRFAWADQCVKLRLRNTLVSVNFDRAQKCDKSVIRIVNCKVIELVNLGDLFVWLLIFDFKLCQRINPLLLLIARQLKFLLLKKTLILLDVKRIVNQLDLDLQIWILRPKVTHSEAPLSVLDLEGAWLFVKTICQTVHGPGQQWLAHWLNSALRLSL